MWSFPWKSSSFWAVEWVANDTSFQDLPLFLSKVHTKSWKVGVAPNFSSWNGLNGKFWIYCSGSIYSIHRVTIVVVVTVATVVSHCDSNESLTVETKVTVVAKVSVGIVIKVKLFLLKEFRFGNWYRVTDRRKWLENLKQSRQSSSALTVCICIDSLQLSCLS